MKLEASLKRKYIYLTAKPGEDIPEGLRARVGKDTIHTDIKKGVTQYARPEATHISKVWVKRKPKRKRVGYDGGHNRSGFAQVIALRGSRHKYI